MKLLVLTQKVDPEDAILGFFVQWLDGLARRTEKLDVIALEKGVYGLPDNTEVLSLGKERGAGSLVMLLRLQMALLRHLRSRSRRPDAILVHMVPKYALYAWPLARLFSVPIDLWYTHKSVDPSLRRAHGVIRHAYTASDASFRLESPKKIVTGHGIDTRRFDRPEKDDRKGLLTVGRITPSKDQAVILEALARLKGRLPDDAIHTRIVGEPLLESDFAYRKKLDRLVVELGIEELVRFDGAVPHQDLAARYRAASIVINASHTGSVDKVVLEAMASGALPLTCNESFEPLLEDLAPRLVFAKGDASDLAGRIEDLLTLKPEVRHAMELRLRDIVIRDHDLEALMDRLVAGMSGSSASPGRSPKTG